jgi:hypothetical protein
MFAIVQLLVSLLACLYFACQKTPAGGIATKRGDLQQTGLDAEGIAAP